MQRLSRLPGLSRLSRLSRRAREQWSADADLLGRQQKTHGALGLIALAYTSVGVIFGAELTNYASSMHPSAWQTPSPNQGEGRVVPPNLQTNPPS